MTNFEIALRFTGLTPDELARRLDVPAQLIRSWIKGTRLPGRASVEYVARQMGVDAAFLLGVPALLPVAADGDCVLCPVLRTEPLPGVGARYCVVAPDGEVREVDLPAVHPQK